VIVIGAAARAESRAVAITRCCSAAAADAISKRLKIGARPRSDEACYAAQREVGRKSPARVGRRIESLTTSEPRLDLREIVNDLRRGSERRSAHGSEGGGGAKDRA